MRNNGPSGEVDVGQSISTRRLQELGLRESQVPVGPSGESTWAHSVGVRAKVVGANVKVQIGCRPRWP